MAEWLLLGKLGPQPTEKWNTNRCDDEKMRKQKGHIKFNMEY